MESAQRALVSALLDHIRSLGLISNTTHSRAMDLVHSVIDVPDFFRYPVCLTEEAKEHECTPDTKRNADGKIHL